MTTTVTATDTAAAAKPAATEYRVDQAVVHNDKLHVVSRVRGQRVETCKGELLLAKPEAATDTQTATLEWCLECHPTPQVEPALEGPALTLELVRTSSYGMPAMASAYLRAQAYREAQQQETPAEQASTRKARVKANRAIAEAAAPEPKPNPVLEAALEATRIANQPTLAAIAAGKVGTYELIEAPKGVWALRGPDGKLLADNGKKAYRFDSKGDAAWYAQRRTRLAQYVGFGGTARLHMPKVGRTGTWGDGRTWAITGELGKDVQAHVNGKPVGPTWPHPTNGLVDAMRWLQRVERKLYVA